MPMTYDEAANAMRTMSDIIRAKEKEFATAMSDASDAEALYRRSLADKYRAYRGEGKAVDESNTLARGDCFRLSRDRDKAMGKVRKIGEELEDRRGERVSLHRLVEWSTALALIDHKIITDTEGANGAVPG